MFVELPHNFKGTHMSRFIEILNQIAETARVRDIAEMVAKLFDAEVQMVANPRQEDAENELVVSNEKFKLLGLDPILLDSAEGLMTEVSHAVAQTLNCASLPPLPR